MSQNDAGLSTASQRVARWWQRWSMWVFGLLAIAIIMTGLIIGLVLVFDARLDDPPSRNNLGVGLVTGGLIGISLTALEYALERGRTEQENKAAQRQHEALVKYARGLLARLVVRHAHGLMSLFLADQQTRQLDRVVKLEGGEIPRVHLTRGVQWVADKDVTEASWYTDQRTVESVDVLLQVGTHVAQIEHLQLENAEWDILRFHTEETADRLTKTADYLSQGGDPNIAQSIADVASTLRGAATTPLSLSHLVGGHELRMPRWEDQRDVQGFNYIFSLGIDPRLSFIRESVGYLTDKLREGFERASGDDSRQASSNAGPRRIIDQMPSNDDIVKRRWGLLLPGNQNSDPWAGRFAENSWLRAVLATAAEEVPESYGAALAHGTDFAETPTTVGADPVSEAFNAPQVRHLLRWTAVDKAGRPYPAGQVQDLGVFGVHKARTDLASTDAHAADPYYRYVERPLDHDVAAALDRRADGTDGRMLLLVGEAMSGKSRTGTHALITHPALSQRPLLIPEADAELRQVIDVAPANGALLWLDDLTRFGTGLNVSVLRDWQERQGLVVVGTLRSDYINQFRDSPNLRPLLEVIEDESLVEPFDIPREWSEEDQKALAGADLRVREKVADGWSLGEVLGAAPELWNYLKGANPYQRAVALTVVDWVRTGIATGITADQAEKLWTHYLPRLESNRLKDKASDRQHFDFTEALEWSEIPALPL